MYLKTKKQKKKKTHTKKNFHHEGKSEIRLVNSQ